MKSTTVECRGLGEASKTAPILAEMRKLVNDAREYPADIEITTGDVEDWADRIEEAVINDMVDCSTACYLTLFEPVQAMREAQKENFKTRSNDALRKAKNLERKVDLLIAQALAGTKQEELPL